MPKRNKKQSSNVSKMPSIWKKYTETGTLSESHRKVLHRCRMMLLKDLDVRDILDYMCSEDGCKPDVRDTILSYPDRERRVSALLDRLETRGDRTFSIFMQAVREHYKHLHYVLEETLQDIDEKDQKYKDHQFSITGESVRKIIKNSLHRRTQYSQGSESADDLDLVFDDHDEDAYIDCYSIPMKGRLQKEPWIKQIEEIEGSLDSDNEEENNYTAVVLKDLLFKEIKLSEIPEGVKQPPKYCGDTVFVIDNENKYGIIKKERKIERVINLENDERSIDLPDTSRTVAKDKLVKYLSDETLMSVNQMSQELPDYTAPPPPAKSKSTTELSSEVNKVVKDQNTISPPPLPPKPGNLPSVTYKPPILKPRIPTQDKQENNTITDNGVISDEKESSPPALPKSLRTEENDIVRPPPRSTSLSQALSQAKTGEKPLPSPKMGSKFLINKSKTDSSISESSSSASLNSSRTSSISPDKTLPSNMPPVPPRKYMDAIGGLSGAGAISSPFVAQLSPRALETTPHTNNTFAFNKITTTLDMQINQQWEEENRTTNNPMPERGSQDSEKFIKGQNMDKEVKSKEEEFDPYSMGVDNIFQNIQVNDVAQTTSKDDSQSSGTGTVVGSNTHTLTKDVEAIHNGNNSDEDSDFDCDVDTPIPVPDDEDEEYEAVGGANSRFFNQKESSPEQDYTSAGRDRSRDSTPYDSEDAKRDSRDASTLDSSFKASGDSMNSNTTPGSQGTTSATTDSGIDVVSGNTVSQQPPPLMIPQRGVHPRINHISSRPLPKDPPKSAEGTNSLNDVHVLANDQSDDNDLYYEDIDVLDKGKFSHIDASEKTSVSYLDPKKYFQEIGKMAQQGLNHVDGMVKKFIGHEEIDVPGRALIKKDELLIAEVQEAYNRPKSDDKVTMVTVDKNPEPEGAIAPPIVDSNNVLSNDKLKPHLTINIIPEPEATIVATTDINVVSENETDGTNSNDSNQTNNRESVTVTNDVYSDYRFTTLVYDKIGRAFYMPSQYLKRHGDPAGEPWFYPIAISSHQATLFLSAQKQEGCFLVYKPNTKKSKVLYNLSLCRNYDEIVHYHIVKNIHGDVLIDGHDHSFLNVKDLVLYFHRNKSQLATKLRRPLREASLPITPGYHYDLKWEISRTHLSLTGNIIGKGNFGAVCVGKYHSNISVAVKVLEKVDASLEEQDDFIDEANCLMGLSHDHIVQFVGVSCTAKPFFLVYEYLPKGHLRECLQNNIVPSDNIEQLFFLCIQVTSAMNYLESQRFVLHRDLASHNFLVADDLCVKLADFGRARLVNDDNYQAPKTEKIPIKWASPEVLIDSSYSTKSDVWALGIVFWEILSSGNKPYEGLTGEQTAVYVIEGGRLDKPIGCPVDLFNMINSCWGDCPDDRPSFAVLYDKLKGKSSIYYSSPIHAEPALPKAKKKDSALSPAPNKSPTTPRAFGSSSKNKIQRSLSMNQTNGKKTRHTVMIDNRSGSKDVLQSREETKGHHHHRPVSGGSDRLMTSGSETSLNSTLASAGIDDLTRGDKIRKSIRKIMNLKNNKRKISKMDGLKEHNNGKGLTRSPSVSIQDEN